MHELSGLTRRGGNVIPVKRTTCAGLEGSERSELPGVARAEFGGAGQDL